LFVDNLSRRSFFWFQSETREVEATIIFPWKLKKRDFFTCFASKRNSKNLKQIKREMKQKRSKTKNVKQNNAEKPIWKQRDRFEAKLGNLSF
jgi:hypothetical protein